MTAEINVDGFACLAARVRFPYRGPWFADVVFEDAPDIGDAVTLTVGSLVLSGTVDPSADSTFAAQRATRIVGGANGWVTLASSRHYHNDAGVKGQPVASDLASLVGETLGSYSGREELGIDYVRMSGSAARALEEIGGVGWWVDAEGMTHVGERTTSSIDSGKYSVLEHEPRERVATLGVDDFAAIVIGGVIEEGLEVPLTIREIEIDAQPDGARVHVWGGEAQGGGRLAGLMRRLVKRSAEPRIFGRIRYRVVRMSGDRVELQVFAQGTGAPDVLPISIKPGMAGVHAVPALSSIVLVEFIEGDPTLPIVSGFAGKDEEGHEATSIDFSAAVTLRLGSDSASEGVTLGTSHKSWADGHRHGYVDSVGSAGTPAGKLTTSPASAVDPATGTVLVADNAPAVSTKVFAE